MSFCFSCEISEKEANAGRIKTVPSLSFFAIKYRILEVERSKNLKIPQDMITLRGQEDILKFKEQENLTALQACNYALYDCILTTP